MIRDDLTNEQYHAHSAISSSDVKAAAKSLAHWKGAERRESTAFDLGTAFHELCLEPHQEMIVRGPATRRGNDWKEAYEIAKQQGKLLLTASDYDVANAMAESAMRMPRIRGLIQAEDAMIERSIFVECPETGLELKCRPDCYVPSKTVCLDLKSTTDAGPSNREFESHVWKYKYDIQAAFYKYVLDLAGLPVTHFAFAAVEKTPPYAACLHLLSMEVMEYAHTKMMNILKRIAQAEAQGVYPTDWPEINMIHMPEWMKTGA